MNFTVVTPNLNMGNYLGDTIESVLRNLQQGDEYFIIDGASTDTSLDVIRRYETRLTGWVSERDSGYADAINKGFRLANGNYLCWINSGDLMLSGALDKARKALKETGADMIFGDDLLIDEKGKIIQVTNGHAHDLRAMMLYAGWTPLQESCFWTRSIYEGIGGINSNIKYAADYDFFLRLSLSGRCEYVAAIFGAFRRHDGQLSMAKSTLYKIERENCRSRELDVLSFSPYLIILQVYYWFKLRWRVRVLGKKRNMSHLVHESVNDLTSQCTNNRI